eukprot:5093653-Amphidinium_carterae.1
MAAISGLTDAQVNKLVTAGIDTGAKWAFATSYQPGASGDDSALMKFAEEMFAIIAAEMQVATNSSSADMPKRLATSER